MQSQEITDYRLILTNYDSDKLDKFISDINAYLKKGYTLKGPTKSISTYLSQVVIKCVSSEPVIERYKIVGMYGNNPMILERSVMDSLRDGWSIYGDHDYSSYSTDSTFYTWQALVKYKKITENPFDTI